MTTHEPATTRLLIYWAIVAIPLAYGVLSTLANSLQLFH